MKTEIFFDATLDRASEIIKKGGVVAVPTETIYGLSANGLDPKAIEKIYEAKGRPETKPISLFVENMTGAENFCRDIPDEAYILANKFWPGPLTMIFKRKSNVPDILTAGGDTVGIRCPDNPLTVKLLELTGLPLTGTSANLSGQPNANDINEVMAYFDGKIEGAVDGGKCGGGVPSTVLDMTRKVPKILRAGGVSKEKIELALNMEIE
jgi:L-threonylcarbamoyladenylate synthase